MINGKRTHTERYKVVHDKLIEQILTQRLKKGDKIPSERKLCEQYGVSMITVRKALDILVDERVIEKHQGSGNFVSEVKKVKIALLLSNAYDRPPLTVQMTRDINDTSSAFELIPYALKNMSAFEVKRFLIENEMPTILLAAGGFNDMARHNMLTPLDDLKGFDNLISDVPGNIDFRSTGHDGLVRHFSLPLFLSPAVFAVNTKLAAKCSLPVDRAPQDWAEIMEWCGKFREWAKAENNGLHATYGFADHLVSANISYLLTALGISAISDDFDEINNPEIGDFITFLSELISQGDMELLDNSDRTGREPFVEGKHLFCMSVKPRSVFELEKAGAGFEYKLFPIPPRIKDGKPASGFGSARLCIASMNAEDLHTREACWRAVRDLFTYDRLDETAYELKSYPASVSCMRRITSKSSAFKAFSTASFITSSNHAPKPPL